VSLVLLAGLLVAAIGAPAASAKTYDVTRHNDPTPGTCKPSNCSLREAIRAANSHRGKDAVVLPDRHPRYRLSRPNVTVADEDFNTRGDLDVTSPLTIRHGGPGMATIDAQGIDRVLDVQTGAATKLVRIKLTGGDHVLTDPAGKRATPSRRGPLEAGDGGGVFALAPLTLVSSAVVANGGVDGGGGIEAERLTLIRTRVSRNKTLTGTSGGVDTFIGLTRIVRSTITDNHAANAGGGIVISNGKLRMTKSTVANNVAAEGAAGVYPYESNVRITQSTISGNSAHNNSGGGISATASKVVVVNSTVTGNRADTDGGGIESSISGGQMSLNSVTVARNVANVDNDTAVGGGTFNEGNAASWSVVNSIVALNRSASIADDCKGDFTSGGGNLIGNVGGCTGFGPGDLLGMGPKLGQLKSNGGPTKTLALKKGSHAIGKAKKSAAPKRDQRGRKRDGHPDIGAFERLH
jgi:CSLREA domain-containing protein